MATYRTPVLEHFVWQPSVKDRITQAALEALNPWTKGWRYLLTDGANADKIVYANASGSGAYVAGNWSYDVPIEGMAAWVDDENEYYKYDGAAWSMYIGKQGTKGDQGTKGATGAQGTKGVQGTKGATGAQGTKGVQGTKGATGAQGTKGVQGTKGATGAQGTPGTQATYDISYECLIITTG